MARYCPLCDRRMDEAECPLDGVPTVDLDRITPLADPLAPGTVVARRYHVERAIGEGATGAVFLATRVGMLSRVALKVLRREIAVSRATLKRFYQEARAVSALDHPNIVRLIDFGVDAELGLPFLAMEFIEGPTLRDLVLAYGRMPERRAAALLAQVAKALVEAHQKSIIHRDLKPANIVISVLADGDEHVKVLDFGVAKVLDETGPPEEAGLRITIPGTALGTPLYMSPEQAAGDQADFRSDLYSLGCVLHELLTGEPPFLGEGMREVLRLQLSAPPPILPARLTDGDPPSRDLIALHAALLAKRPVDRPSSTAVVAWIIGALARGEQIGAEALLRRSARPGETSIDEDSPAPQTISSAPSPSPAPLAPTKTNLPPELTTFVGRERALDTLGRMFETGARLVTVTGAGGTGKTRLAKRYGTLSVHQYKGGVWFADLTEAKDTEALLAVVAEALEAPLVVAGADPVAHLGQAMRQHANLLLILDNLEQLVKSAPATLGRWLSLAPDARFLVTSREVLLFPGEMQLQLQPLDVDEGVQLFETRARASRPQYRPSTSDAARIEEIVRRLDGVPLAIELAAARIGVLSLEQLAERLSSSFAVLAQSGSSTAPRHRTIRNAIDWSWNLLEPWEQCALAQTSVFAGGFSLEAAESVIDLSPSASERSVLDAIQSLTHKSLVHAAETPIVPGELRFGVYGSIREYSAEKLDKMGLRLEAESRHTAYYLGEAEKWAEGASGSRALRNIRALRLELDNLTAVIDRTERTSPSDAARAALALEPMLTTRGPLDAAIRILDRAVESAERSPDKRLYVRALLARENARNEAGAATAAESETDIERALAEAWRMGSKELEGQALFALARHQLEMTNKLSESRATYARALKLFRETKQRLLEGRALVRIGYTYLEQGLSDDARGPLEEGLEIARALDDRRYEGYALGTISLSDHKNGRLGEARAKLDRSIAIHRSLGNRRFESMDLAYLGLVDYELGSLEVAKQSLEESLRISREMGQKKWEGFALAIRGALQADAGDLSNAAASFEEARARMRSVIDAEHLLAIDVLEGVLDVARGRALAPGDPGRKSSLDAARSRLSRLSEVPAGAASGSDVFIVSRILAKRIDASEKSAT